MKRFVLLLISLITSLPIITLGQLSGTYTIGGTQPDYPTPLDAANALTQQGVSGGVTFNIRPGTYAGFSLGSIPNLNYPDSVIFQAENLDSSSVIITSSNEVIQLNLTQAICLKHLTIINNGGNFSDSRAIYARSVPHLSIIGCAAKNIITSGNVGDESTIDIYMPNIGDAPGTVYLRNCIVQGYRTSITVQGENGTLHMQGNKTLPNVNTVYTGLQIFGYLPIRANNNYFEGRIDLTSNGGIFTNNTVGSAANLHGFDSVAYNQFTDTAYLTEISVSTRVLFRNNITPRYYTGSLLPSTWVVGNTFANTFSAGHSEYLNVIDNMFHSSANLSFIPHSTFAYNEVYKISGFSFCDNSSVYNNIFHALLSVGLSYDINVFQNNFIDTAFLKNAPNPSKTQYNNFTIPPIESAGDISYNNYTLGYHTLLYPAANYSDPHPYFIDPQYDANYRAQNPMLIGKGLAQGITHDIDSNLRPFNSTIGASEICLTLDTVQITCGESITLSLCAAPHNSSTWSPNIWINDTTTSAPTVNPKQNTTYVLLDSLGAAIDSVTVLVTPFIPQTTVDYEIVCSGVIPTLLGINSTDGIYSWSPTDGLSDTTVYNPTATPTTTTSYVQQLNIPGCGTYLDTINVIVDAMPIANAFPMSDHDARLILWNMSSCANTFTWYFGDGDSSHLPGFYPDTFSHQYDTAGFYTITLIACNAFGCDTFTQVKYILPRDIPTGIDLTENISLNVYPNPFNDLLQVSSAEARPIDITINNALGQTVHIEHLSNVTDYTLHLSHLSNGIYFIHLAAPEGTLVKQLVKQ